MSEFWPEFWSAIFENGQSEWLQLTMQAVLEAGFAEYMFRKGEEEHYKTQLMIENLKNELNKKNFLFFDEIFPKLMSTVNDI